MSTIATARTLDAYAARKLSELPETIRRRIRQASWDLYFGPDIDEDDYPGFVAATREIADAVDDIGGVWIDTDFDDVTEDEPRGYEDSNPDYDPDDDESEPTVWVEPRWESIVSVSRSEVLGSMLGELASYL